MKLLKKYFNILDFDTAITRLKNNTLPPRSLVITFDDGYADNYDIAYPILSSLDIPATFFIAVGYLNGGIMWNDIIIESISSATDKHLNLGALSLGEYEIDTIQKKLEAIYSIIATIKYNAPNSRKHIAEFIAATLNTVLPDNLMMTDKQVSEMAANGMTIGGHTVTHPILTTVDNNTAYDEIYTGKLQLERIINKSVKYFAFPNGKPEKDYNYEHVKMLKEIGFDASVSTAYGTSNASADMYQLARFTPWDQTELKYLLRLIINSRTQPTICHDNDQTA